MLSLCCVLGRRVVFRALPRCDCDAAFLVSRDMRAAESRWFEDPRYHGHGLALCIAQRQVLLSSESGGGEGGGEGGGDDDDSGVDDMVPEVMGWYFQKRMYLALTTM